MSGLPRPGWDGDSPLEKHPVVRTSRLVLDGLRAEDKPAYNRLCLDGGWNRWWGYDYREDLGDNPGEDSFLDSVRADFQSRTEASFAIRLEGRFIGELVLHHFDGRGGVELGCRVLPEYAGQGYGTEAFCHMADWCLHTLGMDRVAGKCHRENLASQRMLSPAGEDGDFLYFIKSR